MPKENKKKINQDIVVALEIHEKFVKLCAADLSGKKPVFSLFRSGITSEGGNLSETLANLFKIHNLSRKRIFLNIPRHLVMARSLHLPSVNDEEIKNMVKMEAVKHMPYRDEDVITGHRVTGRLKDGYSDVLLVMSQASAIEHFIDILKNAGLSAEKIALSSESLFVWYSALPGKAKERQTQNIAVISVDPGCVDIAIAEKGKLAFTRAFSQVSGDKDSARKTVEEIKRSVATYKKENNSKVEKIIISGAEKSAKEIAPLLKEETGIEVESVTQTGGIEIEKNVDADLKEISFIELIGLLRKRRDIRINLLPEKLIEKNELGRLKKILVRTMILAGCITLVFLSIIAQKIFNKSRLLSAFNAKISAMAPEVTSAKRMRDDLKIIKSEIRKKPLAIEVLSEIYRVTPSGITFNLVDYESGKALVLRGAAPTLDSIIKFITIVENSHYFENVKLKYTAKRTTTGREVTDFEILCLLSNIR